MSLARVGVVGAGLIGTSVGLALRRHGGRAPTVLVDADPARAAAAAALGAGVAGDWGQLGECTHVVVAVPPNSVVPVLTQLSSLDARITLSDTTSVKSEVLREVETIPALVSRFCGGHPIAGRERGGPGQALAELFDHAVWAITPPVGTSEDAVDDATALAQLCGARPMRVSAADHDAALAAVSHGPQVVASTLAADLVGAGPLAPVLAGAGFRDTTRVADADPALWTEILVGNASAVADAVDRVSAGLAVIAAALRRGDPDTVRAAIAAGNAARSLLPGKPSAPRAREWNRVGVVLADRPGELARLLGAAGEAGVNVEDISIEHAVDRPVGFVELAVDGAHVDDLLAAVRARGWAAHVVT